MTTISQQDIEFLIFFEEELAEIEANGFGFIRELDLRALSSRLRNLLHSTEGTLARAFNIFNVPLVISPENIPFLYTSHDRNSAAVYAVEFHDVLTFESMQDFAAQKVTDGQFTLIYPLIGFNKDNAHFDATKSCDLNTYLQAPVFGIDGVLVNRWQLISFLSNKKGLSHYSASRDKLWQTVLDMVWNHRVSESGSDDSVRSLYEAIQRIANEILSCHGINNVRTKAQRVIEQVKIHP